MNRTFSYCIPIEYAGKKIYEFLKEKGFSHQNLTDIKNYDYGLFVNDKKVLRNHILNDGDTLVINFFEKENSEHIPAVFIPIDIVYEDEDVIVVNKCANMPIHPSLNNYDNSLANALMYYYNSNGQDFVFRCITRLDRDTSGLTLIAKNSVSASILSEQLRNSLIKKEYTAIVSGRMNEESGTIELPIGRLNGSTIERIVDYVNGQNAITHFEVIDKYETISVVKLNLETGRTHQIRVHMKAIGHPLIGDFLYNPLDETMKRQALHVNYLEFSQPITGESIRLHSNMPQDMFSVLDGLTR